MKTLLISVVVPFLLIAMFPLTSSAQFMCEDFCPSSFDGECDDGGPGSLYSICALGSDCGDCGPRQAMTSTPYPGPMVCESYCPYANDGECDDGGPGSLNNLCDYGSDCGDCGPRDLGHPAPMPPHPAPMVCESYCPYANDGECDDGGPGSLNNLCEYGSDCGDCGPRDLGHPVPMPPHPAPMVCESYCPYANDGECDDGGPGSLNNLCEYGSDCGDCGPRELGVLIPAPPHPVPMVCEDYCPYAFDGECDDGGLGSLNSLCAYGSDCGDCGPRHP